MRFRAVDIRRGGRVVASQLIGIDPRALGVFRIGIGSLLLTDLAVRATDLSFFYTDDGVLPRTLLVDRTSPWSISFYVLSGAPAFVAVLFILAAVVAVALLLGYRTRLAAIVSWVLLTSLQNRNPLVNQNGDLLLHLMLFWGLFLPLGARYSLDNLRGRPRAAPVPVVSFASFALLAQVVMMYVFTGLLKTSADWNQKGTAVYYALQYHLLATPRAHLLLAFPGFLNAVTHTVPWIERVGPVLFFIPFVGAPIRIFAVFGFMSFHLGMSTFLALGPFMWVPEVALIPFLPTRFWDSAERWVSHRHAITQTLRRVAPIPQFAVFLPTFILFALPGLSDRKETRHSTPSDATNWAGGILPTSGAAGSTAKEPVAAPEERGGTGKTARWNSVLQGHTLSMLPLLLILYAFLLNMRTVTKGNYVVLPHLQWLGDSLSLDQTWNMFAPRPPHSSGWFVIPATLAGGRTIDLWRGPRPLTWQQPSSIEGLYPNERWRKYAENLSKSPQNQLDYARYLCRSWNTSHHGDSTLVRFKIYFMLLLTPPQVDDSVKPRRVLQVTWFCLSKPPRPTS